MTSPAPGPLARGRLLALLGVLLVAATMRTAVGALSPILDFIDADIPLDHVLLSVIGATPPLVFAVSGLIAPLASRRLGLEGALLAATLVGAVGHLLRAAAPDANVLLIGTVLALLGAGCANVLLPPIVKRYFPDRIGTVTAIYVTIMSIGATVPPIVAVPVAQAGGWRVSLGVWLLVAVVAAAPWAWQLLRRGRHVENLDTEARGMEAAHAGIGARLVRSPIAWSMALLFGLPSMHAYAMFAWLPTLAIEESGVDAAQAGLLLGVFAFCGIPAALLIPVLATRLPSVTPLIVAAVVFFATGYLGFLLAPAVAPVLWAVLVGFGPLLFPLALTLINLRTRTHVGSVALSGFVQGIGYVIGAGGPLVVGVLRDATGDWTVPIIFLLATMVLAVPALIVLAKPRYVEDEGT
ncbi:MAG: MFS transporter [Actinomycetota bacterium]|nr:MFS transporter [Actinomycetota bacterium]HWM34558.1 MFS transporter [Pseudolysinimonas sp.]